MPPRRSYHAAVVVRWPVFLYPYRQGSGTSCRGLQKLCVFRGESRLSVSECVHNAHPIRASQPGCGSPVAGQLVSEPSFAEHQRIKTKCAVCPGAHGVKRAVAIET